MSFIASLPAAHIVTASHPAAGVAAAPRLARPAQPNQPGTESTAHIGESAGATGQREMVAGTPHPAGPRSKAGFTYETGPDGRLYASSDALVIEARHGGTPGASRDANATFPPALRQAPGGTGFSAPAAGAGRAAVNAVNAVNEASRAPFLALYAANQAGWPAAAPHRVDVFA